MTPSEEPCGVRFHVGVVGCLLRDVAAPFRGVAEDRHADWGEIFFATRSKFLLALRLETLPGSSPAECCPPAAHRIRKPIFFRVGYRRSGYLPISRSNLIRDNV